MEGGVDRGFCLSYWDLSYRRKFLRTVWMIPISAACLVFMYLYDYEFLGIPNWVFVALTVLMSGFQLIWTYMKWQAGRRGLHDGTGSFVHGEGRETVTERSLAASSSPGHSRDESLSD